MCGRFVVARNIEQWVKLYGVTVLPEVKFAPSYNVAPTEQAPVVVEPEGKDRFLTVGRFGIPSSIGERTFPLLNIQSEKAGNREDFNKRRCVIPADGFYEWEKVTEKDRQPYYFSPREGHFSFAGVWKRDAQGVAFTILTTSANEVVEPIHRRMPVILGHNAVSEWLTPTADKELLVSLMQPYPASLMQAWKVSKTVNSPRNKEAACINSL